MGGWHEVGGPPDCGRICWNALPSLSKPEPTKTPRNFGYFAPIFDWVKNQKLSFSLFFVKWQCVVGEVSGKWLCVIVVVISLHKNSYKGVQQDKAEETNYLLKYTLSNIYRYCNFSRSAKPKTNTHKTLPANMGVTISFLCWLGGLGCLVSWVFCLGSFVLGLLSWVFCLGSFVFLCWRSWFLGIS
jgi:hypothetical protein